MAERRVIIGLPVYNGQKYLAAAIESHLSQSFGDFDLVISDNGSTDDTQEICADYARKDERLKYLRSPQNRGILWNHRRVLEAIESPDQYFRWAGADDILEPGLLQTMFTELDTRPDVEAMVPDTKNIDENGEIIGSVPATLDLQSADVFERAHDFVMGHYQQVCAYGLLRSSTLRDMRTGGPDLHLGAGASRQDRPETGSGPSQAIPPRFDLAREDGIGHEEVGGTEFRRRDELPALDLGLRACPRDARVSAAHTGSVAYRRIPLPLHVLGANGVTARRHTGYASHAGPVRRVHLLATVAVPLH
jgi:glycosyltransferase involved in cell wall biosynthesis